MCAACCYHLRPQFLAASGRRRAHLITLIVQVGRRLAAFIIAARGRPYCWRARAPAARSAQCNIVFAPTAHQLGARLVAGLGAHEGARPARRHTVHLSCATSAAWRVPNLAPPVIIGRPHSSRQNGRARAPGRRRNPFKLLILIKNEHENKGKLIEVARARVLIIWARA